MNRLKFPLLLALLSLAIAVQPVVAQTSSPVSSASSAQSGSAPQDPSNPASSQAIPSASSSMSASMDSQTFTGKIAKAGGKYVLKDDTTRTSYTLDDQDRAKEFEGKSVKVTGKLDAGSNTIRVTTIEPGS